jgi:hypothetical protein
MSPTSAPRRKLKRTFSLSAEALNCLERIRKEQRLPSASAALDLLIRAKQLDDENKRISANITNYYDSIGKEEMAENRAWGELAQTQLPEE